LKLERNLLPRLRALGTAHADAIEKQSHGDWEDVARRVREAPRTIAEARHARTR
jgi:hypothetical protein